MSTESPFLNIPFTLPQFQFVPNGPTPNGPAFPFNGCQPLPHLTEADVRRIVREELAEALKKEAK